MEVADHSRFRQIGNEIPDMSKIPVKILSTKVLKSIITRDHQPDNNYHINSVPPPDPPVTASINTTNTVLSHEYCVTVSKRCDHLYDTKISLC